MKKVTIDASEKHYRLLNEEIKALLAEGSIDEIELVKINGHRYIGTGIHSNAVLDIHGIPGNDLGAFMDGLTIRVHNQVQDGVGNTMNSGKIVIHGYAGDVTAYGMRSGKIFIRDDVGYRACIHMKEYKELKPVVIIGGCTGDFAAEYMAGGIMIVLGLNRSSNEPLVGDYFATGMHGGVAYVRGRVDERYLGKEVKAFTTTKEDLDLLTSLIEEFCLEFPGYDPKKILDAEFSKIIPVSKRPYGRLYSYGNTPLEKTNYGDYAIIEG